ncbi:MAG: hypothetical protein EXR77_12165, partial [Myxococcales bacterium]|nr:hypothetical protein [Myxococcales bacterium]
MDLAADHACSSKTESVQLADALAVFAEETSKQRAEWTALHQELEHQIAILKRQIFGQSSEKQPKPKPFRDKKPPADPVAVDKAMALILEVDFGGGFWRWILEVYRVEHQAKELGIARTEAHQKLRTEKCEPAMAKLNTWLQDHKAGRLPSSPRGKAMAYCVNHWSFLTVFLTNAGVPVDNTASERARRTYAHGRKNWPFMGNDLAGEHYAVLMTLVRSCEAHGVNPIEYPRSPALGASVRRCGAFLLGACRKSIGYEMSLRLYTMNLLRSDSLLASQIFSTVQELPGVNPCSFGQ